MSATGNIRQDGVDVLPRLYMRESNSLQANFDRHISNTANQDLLRQFRLDLAELELRDTRLRLLSADENKESTPGWQPSTIMLCKIMEDLVLLMKDGAKKQEDASASKKKPAVQLTARQREILLLATNGLSNLEIAQHLNMSTTTVSQHLSRMYKVLGVPSRGKAIARCRDLGLL